MQYFWPRAMLKVPKRSFVVVVVLGGVESWAKNVPKGNCSRTKNVPNGTKNVREQKTCKREQKKLLNECKIIMELYSTSLNELLWPNESKVLSSVANYWNCGIELPYLTWMALCGLAVFTAIDMCGLVWSYMAFQLENTYMHRVFKKVNILRWKRDLLAFLNSLFKLMSLHLNFQSTTKIQLLL